MALTRFLHGVDILLSCPAPNLSTDRISCSNPRIDHEIESCPDAQEASMIQLNEVHVTFPGGMTALHPTSLRFNRGEFTVLLGASGAGKSTLLRCLNLLNRPSAGGITVEGLGDVRDRRTLHLHRRGTGMIFQQHQLIGRQSALANVLLGR